MGELLEHGGVEFDIDGIDIGQGLLLVGLEGGLEG